MAEDLPTGGDDLTRGLTALSARAGSRAVTPDAAGIAAAGRRRRQRRRAAVGVVPVVAALAVAGVLLARTGTPSSTASSSRGASISAPRTHGSASSPSSIRGGSVDGPDKGSASIPVRGLAPTDCGLSVQPSGTLRADAISVTVHWARPGHGAVPSRCAQTRLGAAAAASLTSTIESSPTLPARNGCPESAGSVAELTFAYRSGPTAQVTVVTGLCDTVTFTGGAGRNGAQLVAALERLHPPAWFASKP